MKRILVPLLFAAGWLPAQEPPVPPTPPMPVPTRIVRTNAPAAAPAPITNSPGVRILPAIPAPAAVAAPTNRPAVPALPEFPRPLDMTRFRSLSGTNLINALYANGHTNVAASMVVRQGLTNYVYGPPPAGFELGAKTNAAAAAASSPAGTMPPGRSAAAIFSTNTPPAAAGTNVVATGNEEEIAPGVIRLQATDLTAVLDIYSELVGRTILRPAALPDVKITLRNQGALSRSEAIRALEAVLNMNGIAMVNVGEKFVKVVAEVDAAKAAKKPSDSGEIMDMPDLSGFVTVVRQLTNAKPSEVVQALTPFAKMGNALTPIDSSGILVIRDYGDNVKRMMEMLDKIDVSIPLEVEPVVIPIKYALAGDIAQVLGQLTSGGSVSTTGSSSASRGGLSTSGRSSYNRGGYGSSGYGGYGGGQYGNTPYGSSTPYGSMGSTTSGITPTTSPGSAQSNFADRLRSIVSKAAGSGDITVLGQAKIIADERINALLVFADKRDREMITNIIAKLDVVLAQVLIEALIVEVGLSDNEEYGISYLQRANSKGKFTGAGAINNANSNPFNDPASVGGMGTNLASGFSYFGKWGGDLDIAAKALASDSRASVLSRPRIQTSHAVQASIFVGETRPYPMGSSYGGYAGYGYSQIQQTRIGIELSVLPLINQDGLVVMEIQQNIQNVGETVKIDNVGDVPSTIDRSANAKVAVKNKETIILGGFISSDFSKSKSGVPVLKDIPGLGALFRSSSQKRTRKELVVFIRPTVLDTPESAAMLASEERKKVSPVYQAEKEFESQEAKRTEAIKKEMNGKGKSSYRPKPQYPSDTLQDSGAPKSEETPKLP